MNTFFALFYILNSHGNVAAVTFDASTETTHAACLASAQRSATILTGQAEGGYRVVASCTTQTNLGDTLKVAAILYTCERADDTSMACAAVKGLR